jgi:hypothetical protein
MGATQSLSVILKHKGKSFSLKEIPEEILAKLSEVERKIISARLDGLCFSQQSESDLRFAADQIILKAAYIVGCPTPLTDFYADGLCKEMMEYINQFGFHEFTLAEIILAIRLNTKGCLRFPTGVEVEKVVFVGACFNVDFLSMVLTNYLAIRNLLDRKLENLIDGY